jgi:hypothetical protein
LGKKEAEVDGETVEAEPEQQSLEEAFEIILEPNTVPDDDWMPGEFDIWDIYRRPAPLFDDDHLHISSSLRR